MPRILLDGRYLGEKPSGIGRYTRELVAGMQRERPELEFRFVLHATGDERPLVSHGSIDFDHEPYGPYTSFLLGGKLAALGPADLFHSPFHVTPRGLTCPSVLTMHDAFNFEQNKTSNYAFPVSWAEWAYFLWAIPDAIARARRVVCVSETTASEIGRRVPSSKPKLRVIPHGVTPKFRLLPDAAVVAARCAELTGSDEPFLLSVGAVSPNKNHEGMLRAFAAAFPEGSRVRYAAVNRFGKSDRLAALAQELGVADRYIRLGSPSDDDMVTLLNGAMGLFFCSKLEGFGIPILEAMACGCPVITSTVSCLPEVAGGAALLANPFEVEDMARAAQRLHAEASLRGELRQKGLERAPLFTWEKAAHATLEVYDEVLAGV
jgi:glycosyltransferase involved in cell wall biosynthesis